MNVKVLKRFLNYVGITAIGMGTFFGISFLAKTYLGHEGYGVIGLIGIFMVWFLYTMAKSDVESAEREEKWAQEKLARK
jgi:hypothetical protein|tara:strand:- start:1694 stop:1930 length:237 start_codon:yes stop_codon:yes gene_type:complete